MSCVLAPPSTGWVRTCSTICLRPLVGGLDVVLALEHNDDYSTTGLKGNSTVFF